MLVAGIRALTPLSRFWAAPCFQSVQPAGLLSELKDSCFAHWPLYIYKRTAGQGFPNLVEGLSSFKRTPPNYTVGSWKACRQSGGHFQRHLLLRPAQSWSQAFEAEAQIAFLNSMAEKLVLSAKTEEEESAAYELISQVITFFSIHRTISGLVGTKAENPKADVVIWMRAC